MTLSSNLLLYFVVSVVLGYFLCVLTKKADGTSRLPWLLTGTLIGVACGAANLGGVLGSLPIGNTFKLDLPFDPIIGSLGTGLLIGLPIGLITAYDMSRRFTWVDAWLLFFKVGIIFVVIGGTIASLSDVRYTGEQWLDFLVFGLAQGGIYALIALGYTLVYGILFMINFAHGEVFMAGAFTAFFTADALATPSAETGLAFIETNPVSALALIFLTSIVTSTVVAVLLERIAYRPLRRSPRLVLLITAIGASFFLQYSFRGFYGSGVKAYPEVPILHGNSLLIADVGLTIGIFGLALLSYLLIRLTIYTSLTNLFRRTEYLPPLITLGIVVAIILSLSQWLQAIIVEQFDRLVPLTEQLSATLDAQFFTVCLADDVPVTLLSQCQLPITRIQFLIIVSSIVMMAGLYTIVQRTKIGKAMRAVAEDKDVAALMGIDVDRVISFTFGLGAAFAGAAGVLYALMFLQVQFFMGFLPGLKAFTAAVLGGIGSVPGAMIGGFFLGIVESLGPSLFLEGLGIPAAYQLKDVIAFTMLVLVLIFRPAGIMGIDLDKKKA